MIQGWTQNRDQQTGSGPLRDDRLMGREKGSLSLAFGGDNLVDVSPRNFGKTPE